LSNRRDGDLQSARIDPCPDCRFSKRTSGKAGSPNAKSPFDDHLQHRDGCDRHGDLGLAEAILY
jgi:hypothetical protein